MKVNLFVCLLSLVVLAMGDVDQHPRGCIYIDGLCHRECEEGTHSYTNGCGYVTPEATCDEPNPVPNTRGIVCDYSSCYCDSPTVRDMALSQCVRLEQCSKKASNAAQPDAGADKDVANATQPDAGADKDVANATQPDAGADKDVANATQPDAGADKDVANATQPDAGADKDVANATQPDAGADKEGLRV